MNNIEAQEFGKKAVQVLLNTLKGEKPSGSEYSVFSPDSKSEIQIKYADKPAEKFVADMHLGVAELISNFANENADTLELLVSQNKVGEILRMAKSDLLPNISGFLESSTYSMPTELFTNPNRRVKGFQQSVFDDVSGELTEASPSANILKGGINKVASEKLSEPQHSAMETFAPESRLENVFEVTPELEKEMMQEVSYWEL